jgi:hypothetical protein
MNTTTTIHNNFMFKKDVMTKWKPSSYRRLSTALRKNKNTDVPMTPQQTRLPPPIKLYRKEIATPNVDCTFQRHMVRFDDLNAPNGQLRTTASTLNGTAIYEDPKETLYSRQDPRQCAATDTCLAIEANARKRVRTSGIVKPNYCMNTNQYLQYRQMTYDQNSYHFKHNNVVQPQGDIQSTLTKPYVAITTYKPSNIPFQQQGAVMGSAQTARRTFEASTLIPDQHLKNMEFPRPKVPTFKQGSKQMFCNGKPYVSS